MSSVTKESFNNLTDSSSEAFAGSSVAVYILREETGGRPPTLFTPSQAESISVASADGRLCLMPFCFPRWCPDATELHAGSETWLDGDQVNFVAQQAKFKLTLLISARRKNERFLLWDLT